ncbi:uncharacterized protein SAPINGB_P000207 [Magnusiomyces paraingens]|uniref:DDE Tnp4 domain-containing protein n=1 Tax=Magnusiomyces paraingens TaxID=2606893 RepID=A0A5E8B4T5_9ASCO|nr:uncharacterized protein SAPINGB_P000207 [Saprochaete ingens]VVT43910.1 unnamed protein product [Saprochaete ingens]
MSFVDSTLDDDISDQKENNDFTDQDRNNDITDQNKSDDFTDHDKSDVITAPDGLIIGLYGPFPGSVNDQNAVCETDLLSTLKSRYSFDGIDYCVYGDKDFERQGQLLSEYFVVYLDTDKTKVASNKSMEPLRASIEQVFENIETSFSGALDYRTQLLGKSHFLTSFSVACLLYNFRICLRHRSAAGETFRATPPIFDEYLQYTKS